MTSPCRLDLACERRLGRRRQPARAGLRGSRGATSAGSMASAAGTAARGGRALGLPSTERCTVESHPRCPQDGTEVFFKIKRKSPLKKLMDVYAQRQGGTTNAYRFIFDGNRIVETQTPDDVRNPATRRLPSPAGYWYRRVQLCLPGGTRAQQRALTSRVRTQLDMENDDVIDARDLRGWGST